MFAECSRSSAMKVLYFFIDYQVFLNSHTVLQKLELCKVPFLRVGLEGEGCGTLDRETSEIGRE